MQTAGISCLLAQQPITAAAGTKQCDEHVHVVSLQCNITTLTQFHALVEAKAFVLTATLNNPKL